MLGHYLKCPFVPHHPALCILPCRFVVWNNVNEIDVLIRVAKFPPKAATGTAPPHKNFLGYRHATTPQAKKPPNYRHTKKPAFLILAYPYMRCHILAISVTAPPSSHPLSNLLQFNSLLVSKVWIICWCFFLCKIKNTGMVPARLPVTTKKPAVVKNYQHAGGADCGREILQLYLRGQNIYHSMRIDERQGCIPIKSIELIDLFQRVFWVDWIESIDFSRWLVDWLVWL